MNIKRIIQNIIITIRKSVKLLSYLSFLILVIFAFRSYGPNINSSETSNAANYQNAILGNTQNQVASYIPPKSPTYNQFINEVKNKQIKTATIHGNNIDGYNNKQEEYSIDVPAPSKLLPLFLKYNVITKYKVNSFNIDAALFNLFLDFAPIALIGFFLYRMQKGNMSSITGSDSVFKIYKYDEESLTKKTYFKDIAGADEAKKDLEQVVHQITNPLSYIKMGAEIPAGVILYGPPGNGKTLLAKALANEAKINFIHVSGSEFIEKFVGVGASRVRKLFEVARKLAPCIIFIDEFDSLATSRSNDASVSNSESRQTINQLLKEMDGFNSKSNIFVVAATNDFGIIDSAIKRSKRFDRKIYVAPPNINGRFEILKVHSNKLLLAKDVDLLKIAQSSSGMSGADLATLMNESAIIAAECGLDAINSKCIELAKDKILMGPERKSYKILEKDRDIVAFHEAGHALCSIYNPHSDPIYKATIIPRGGALGYVMRVPETDIVFMSKEKIMGELVVAMGGRAAEHTIFGENAITNGASGDIQSATNIARKMITEWGFGKLGNVYFDNSKSLFSSSENKSSERIAYEIEMEIVSLINDAYEKAKKCVSENVEKLKIIANALKTNETLTGNQILELCNFNKQKEAGIMEE